MKQTSRTATKTDSHPSHKDETNPDQQFFRDAMRHVTPLVNTKVHSQVSVKLPVKQRHVHETGADACSLPHQRYAFSDHVHLPTISSDEKLHYARPGIPDKTLRKLRNGQYTIEAFLDLHGFTAETARETLSLFFAHCLQEGKRHVIVIHGKGSGKKPTLKNYLNHWLRQPDFVLAFCSAKPMHGGHGAVYVLLANK